MSSFILKLFAIITMTIDHIGILFFPTNQIFRIIGRMSMPLFAFQVGVGLKKTSSKNKYILRMFFIALISQLPFCFMLKLCNYTINSLNICFTFTISLLVLYFLELGKRHKLYYVASIILILCSAFISMDYGIYCVFLVITSYWFQDNKIMLTYSLLSAALIYYIIENNTIQLYMLLTLPLLWLYNGKKGKNLKYFFYLFYPLHMLIISLIKYYLNTL